MSEWKTYQPTFTNGESVSFKLPNGAISDYYRKGLHIVTTVHEYKQDGKTVQMKADYKRLSLWHSVKFIFQRWIARLPHHLGLCYKARLGYRCGGRPGECGGE